MAEFPTIEVLGFNGEGILRYLRLADGYYYGGVTHSDYLKEFPFAYGPHVWLMTAGMLDLIGKIANLPKRLPAYYMLQGAGSGRYNSEAITREMHADKIADILGCDQQAIREHYKQVVLIPEEVPADA